MSSNHLETAQQIVTQLSQGNFASVWQRLASSVKEQLSVELLQEGWQGVEAQMGPFKEQLGTHNFQAPQGEIAIVICAFAKATLDVNVVFSNDDQITGLTITPTGFMDQQLTALDDLPPYAKQEMFHEHEVEVGEGEWKLPGTLSLPAGDGPFPAVILVHGSGPNDRDETIGPNKPFRDLAWGLASQGIAILRYDKRTKVYGSKIQSHINTLTVQEEVIDDALAAVALLMQRAPQLDARRVYVLGHSLGGYVLPRIGKANSEIAGLIVLAGLARSLEDTILDQFTYIYSLNGVTSPEQQQKQLDKLKKQVEQVKDPGLSLDTPSKSLPLGVSPAYWLDLRGYHPEEIARSLSQPLLILQGESDYQVTMADFQMWKAALAERGDVQFKSYPALSHLFMPVEGGEKATPATYTIAGHVAAEVVNDIATWVKQHAR